MKNFKLKSKYLLLLLIPGLLFLFSNVKATDSITVSTIEDFQNAINKRYLYEKNDFKFFIIVKHNSAFPQKTNEYYCELALEGLKKLGTFYSSGVQCNREILYSGDTASVWLHIYGTPITPEYHDKFISFVEVEGNKMYAQTKNKEELVKLVYNKMNQMITERHDFFYNDNSPIVYYYRDGQNFLASLFYDYFDIENKIIKGKTTTSATSYWNLVKLGDNWYHIYNFEPVNMYLVSDSNVSTYLSWNNSAYPAATKNYVTASVKETTVIKPIITESDIDAPLIIEDEVTPTPTPDNRDDISSWAKEGVTEATASGLIPEYFNGMNYQEPISREAFCELVIKIYEKISGEKAEYSLGSFTDTTNVAVAKAYSLGIVSGVGNNKFAPYNRITREQISVMFNNTLKALSINPNVSSNYIMFADEAEISSWAKDSVQTLYKLEIMSGVGGNRINPKGTATIEQAILLGNKLYNQYK